MKCWRHEYIFSIFWHWISWKSAIFLLPVYLIYNNNNNSNHFAALCLGLPGWVGTRKTFTHSHPSWSSFITYQLHPSTMFHSIRSLTVFLYYLFPGSLWSRLPLGLEPSTSCSIYFFTQSLSSFCNTCQYHRNLFCSSTEVMSSNPSLALNSTWNYFYLNITHPCDHSYLCPLKCHLIFFLSTAVTSNDWHVWVVHGDCTMCLRVAFTHSLITAVLRPLYMPIYVSKNAQLRTRRFCWSKVLLPACN